MWERPFLFSKWWAVSFYSGLVFAVHMEFSVRNFYSHSVVERPQWNNYYPSSSVSSGVIRFCRLQPRLSRGKSLIGIQVICLSDLWQNGAEQMQPSLISTWPYCRWGSMVTFQGLVGAISVAQQRLEEALKDVVSSRNSSLWLIGFVKWLLSNGILHCTRICSNA